jgi:hypothetical protein
MILVLVDEDEVEFTVHKDSICEKSKFFEAAVSNDSWREGREKIVRLPEINVADFRTYIHWMYTGKCLPEVQWQADHISGSQELVSYTDGYILADVLDDRELRRHILATMIDKTSEWREMPDGAFCKEVWKRTPKGSPLRSFFVLYAWGCLDPLCLFETVSKYPKAFLQEYVQHVTVARHFVVTGKFLKETMRTVLLEIEMGSYETLMGVSLRALKEAALGRGPQVQAEGEAGEG